MTIGKIPEKPTEKRNLDDISDEILFNLVKYNITVGKHFSHGLHEVYKVLDLKYPNKPIIRKQQKERLRCFFNWEKRADTIVITEVYNPPKCLQEIPLNGTITISKPRMTFNDYKGYINDEEFLQRVNDNLIVQQEYKGYSDICKVLSVIPVTGKKTSIVQKDWHRFFNWEVISQRKWIITEIYDIPFPSDKPSRSPYAKDSSNILAKRLYEDSPRLKDMRLAMPYEDNSLDVMIKQDNMATMMGLSSSVIKQNKYQYDNNNKLQVINHFVEVFDAQLTHDNISHTTADINLFKQQMIQKYKSAMNSGLNDLKNKGVVIRYAYTELYFNTKTKSYGALFEKPHLDVEVSNYKDMIMGRYGISDWRQINQLNEIKRAELIGELNSRLEEDLNIKISYGFWIRFNMRILERYYSDNEIDDTTSKSNLKSIIKERQEVSAKEQADTVKKIYDQKCGYKTDYSNNYYEVSSKLFDYVFKQDENIKGLGHMYLTVDRF